MSINPKGAKQVGSVASTLVLTKESNYENYMVWADRFIELISLMNNYPVNSFEWKEASRELDKIEQYLEGIE